MFQVTGLEEDDALDPDEPISSYGIDSMTATELSLYLRSNYNFVVSTVELMTSASCRSLATAVVKQHSDTETDPVPAPAETLTEPKDEKPLEAQPLGEQTLGEQVAEVQHLGSLVNGNGHLGTLPNKTRASLEIPTAGRRSVDSCGSTCSDDGSSPPAHTAHSEIFFPPLNAHFDSPSNGDGNGSGRFDDGSDDDSDDHLADGWVDGARDDVGSSPSDMSRTGSTDPVANSESERGQSELVEESNAGGLRGLRGRLEKSKAAEYSARVRRLTGLVNGHLLPREVRSYAQNTRFSAFDSLSCACCSIFHALDSLFCALPLLASVHLIFDVPLLPFVPRLSHFLSKFSYQDLWLFNPDPPNINPYPSLSSSCYQDRTQ